MTEINTKDTIKDNPKGVVRDITKDNARDASRDNTVFIGKKELMSYVLAVITQFGHGTKTVSVKARGKSISTAVDVAEILRNKFLNDVRVKDIQIKTENLPNKAGTMSNVSSIEITLEKP